MTDLSNEFIPIVLCAGFGTRLKPLTDYYPKPMLSIEKHSAAFASIKKLWDVGFKQVQVNVHAHASLMENGLRQECAAAGMSQDRIRIWHEPEILETGGGIARIAQRLAQEQPDGRKRDILAISGDVVANPPLDRLIDAWRARSELACAALCIRELQQPRKDATWLNTQLNQIVGFRSAYAFPPPTEIRGCLFSNHQVISHDIVLSAPILRESSVVLFFNRGLEAGRQIIPVPYETERTWHDIGTYESYNQCLEETKTGESLSGLVNVIDQSGLITPRVIKQPRRVAKLIISPKDPSGVPFDQLVLRLLDKNSSAIKKLESDFLPVAELVTDEQTLILGLDIPDNSLFQSANWHPLLVPLETLLAPQSTPSSNSPFNRTYFLVHL